MKLSPLSALLSLLVAASASGCAATNDDPAEDGMVSSMESTGLAGLCVEGVDPGNVQGRASLLALHPSCVRLTLHNLAPYSSTGTKMEDGALEAYAAEIRELGKAGISVYLLINVEILGLEPSGGTLDMRALRPVRFREPALAAVNPDAPHQFVAYAVDAVQHLAPAGITRVELVNEPNNTDKNKHEFLDPASYGYLLGKAYPAIKRVAPSVRVTSGAILTTNDVNLDYLAAVYAIGVNGKDAHVANRPALAAWDDTKAMWKEAGGTPWDDIGIHLYQANATYGATPAALSGFANALSAKVDAFYDVVMAGEKLSSDLAHRYNVNPHFYVSEIGWKLDPVCIGAGHETVICAQDTPEVQREEAQQAARVTTVLGALRKNEHIRMLSYFDFADTKDSGTFGLFRSAPYTKANARPSFHAFCTLLGHTNCLAQ